MNSSFFARAAYVIAATLSLCGCDLTVFESAPAKALSACDRRFIGNWRIELSPTGGVDDDDPAFVRFDRHCAYRFVDSRGAQDPDTEYLHVSFAQVGNMSLILGKEQIGKDAQDASWINGYTVFRYEFRDHAIRLYPVDAKRLAHRLIDGEIRGRTQYHNAQPAGYRDEHGSGVQNFIAGDTNEAARVVALEGTFSEEFVVLKPATAADISKARNMQPTKANP